MGSEMCIRDRFNSGALLAFDTSNEAINVTPEVINLLNQANKEK